MAPGRCFQNTKLAEFRLNAPVLQVARIGECAREPRCLAVLAVQHVVPPLLAIAHEQGGGAQKNAAIALGRLAKNPHCLQAIRDNHGIEILGRFLPKMK